MALNTANQGELSITGGISSLDEMKNMASPLNAVSIPQKNHHAQCYPPLPIVPGWCNLPTAVWWKILGFFVSSPLVVLESNNQNTTASLDTDEDRSDSLWRDPHRWASRVLVDDRTLRAVVQVCRRLRDMVYHPYLWRLPLQVSFVPSSDDCTLVKTPKPDPLVHQTVTKNFYFPGASLLYQRQPRSNEQKPRRGNCDTCHRSHARSKFWDPWMGCLRLQTKKKHQLPNHNDLRAVCNSNTSPPPKKHYSCGTPRINAQFEQRSPSQSLFVIWEHGSQRYWRLEWIHQGSGSVFLRLQHQIPLLAKATNTFTSAQKLTHYPLPATNDGENQPLLCLTRFHEGLEGDKIASRRPSLRTAFSVCLIHPFPLPTHTCTVMRCESTPSQHGGQTDSASARHLDTKLKPDGLSPHSDNSLHTIAAMIAQALQLEDRALTSLNLPSRTISSNSATPEQISQPRHPQQIFGVNEPIAQLPPSSSAVLWPRLMDWMEEMIHVWELPLLPHLCRVAHFLPAALQYNQGASQLTTRGMLDHRSTQPQEQLLAAAIFWMVHCQLSPCPPARLVPKIPDYMWILPSHQRLTQQSSEDLKHANQPETLPTIRTPRKRATPTSSSSMKTPPSLSYHRQPSPAGAKRQCCSPQISAPRAMQEGTVPPLNNSSPIIPSLPLKTNTPHPTPLVRSHLSPGRIFSSGAELVSSKERHPTSEATSSANISATTTLSLEDLAYCTDNRWSAQEIADTAFALTALPGAIPQSIWSAPTVWDWTRWYLQLAKGEGQTTFAARTIHLLDQFLLWSIRDGPAGWDWPGYHTFNQNPSFGGLSRQRAVSRVARHHGSEAANIAPQLGPPSRWAACLVIAARYGCGLSDPSTCSQCRRTRVKEEGLGEQKNRNHNSSIWLLECRKRGEVERSSAQTGSCCCCSFPCSWQELTGYQWKGDLDGLVQFVCLPRLLGSFQKAPPQWQSPRSPTPQLVQAMERLQSWKATTSPQHGQMARHRLT